MLFRLLAALVVLPVRLLVAVLRLLLLLPRRPPAPAYVVLRLRGKMRWRAAKRRGLRLGGRRPSPTVHGVLRSIERAKAEPGVRGVIVRPHELHASRAQLVAIRDGLRALREAGKEVVLEWKHASAKDLALLPAASRVVLAPGGPVHVVGHAAAISALRGALDKAGLEPEFLRKGRFKTAPERFTHREVSPEQRALVENVLDHAYGNLVRDLASRRAGDEAWARAVIDGGPYTSRRALAAGIVDELAYPDELPARLGVKESELGGPGRLDARRYWRMEWPRLRAPDQVALVPIHGLIKPGKSARWPGGSPLAGDDSVAEALEVARKDRRVKAVIVSVDSRGGAASASELMWRAVRRCAAEKPTVAYVEQVAASGGYFAAAGAGRIVAAPGALVGSIGVFAGRFHAGALLERLGVRQEIVARGANAALLEPGHALGESERRALQAEIDGIYEEFVERVAEGRSRAQAEILAYAEGRVFVAADAPAALVDEVGDFRAALAWACTEARLDPERIVLRRIEKTSIRPGLGDLLSLARHAAAGAPLLVWADDPAVR